jgi:hypothetical protein
VTGAPPVVQWGDHGEARKAAAAGVKAAW